MNAAAILADPVYPHLKRFVLDHTGLGYFADRDEDFAARLGRRLAVGGCRAYLDRLRNHGRGEMDALVGELTLGETYFFRQREHFDFLRDSVFPALFAQNRPSRTLSIWSAGCATGAEPYSIAMLLRREFAREIKDWEIAILGTDINVEFLARAREAVYDDWAFRETPPEVREACFRRQDRRWALLPEYKRGVAFHYHNLVAGSPPHGGPFDLIMCRNVMIYFGPEQAASVASLFYDALAGHGALLVGHAEFNPAIFRQFRTVVAFNTTVYQKPSGQVPPSAPRPEPEIPQATPIEPRSRHLPAAPPPAARETPMLEDVRAHADRGEWQQAAAECAELIRANPLNAPAHFTAGLVFEHTGRAAEAEAALRRAIYLDRRFTMAHYHLGICLQSTGNSAQARKAFGNALNLLSERPDDEILEHGD